MTTTRCKMCGAAIKISNGQTTAVCEYCGTEQTIPKLDAGKSRNLFERAESYRARKEFDQASALYEQIISEGSRDAEAWWGLILCRYGIEYVEDPVSHERKPTVNRTQTTRILDDPDFQKVLEYADANQKQIYLREERTIDDILHGILMISAREDPFDIFISYKETGADGQRTRSSVYAQDLYDLLTREGYQVFFSRITLEDKLGEAYEPYIFAALQSARVMLVVGTSREEFEAVWVKNEWSRFLDLMKRDSSKSLICVYRDMSPYELPSELGYLQGMDLAKIGAQQDLLRGIRKIVQPSPGDKPVRHESGAANAAAENGSAPFSSSESQNMGDRIAHGKTERGFLYLEEGKWDAAESSFDSALDIDPKNGNAYLGKLLAEKKLRRREDLGSEEDFSGNENCKLVLRFGDKRLQNEIEGYLRQIKEREELRKHEQLYAEACSLLQSPEAGSLRKAAAELEALGNFQDSPSLLSQAKEKLEEAKKKEAERQRAATLMAQREKQQKILRDRHRKAITRTVLVLAAIAAAAGILWFAVLKNLVLYNHALSLEKHEDYTGAQTVFLQLGSYRDSMEKADEVAELAKQQQYDKAVSLQEDEKYDDAAAIFESLGEDYQDVSDRLTDCTFGKASNLAKDGNFEQAEDLLSQVPDDYQGKADLENQCSYGLAVQALKDGDYEKAVSMFKELGTYSDSRDQLTEAQYQLACRELDQGQEDDALALLQGLGTYKDTKEKLKQISKSRYDAARQSLKDGDYDTAISGFKALGDFSDAKDQVKAAEYAKAADEAEKGQIGDASELYYQLGDYKDAKIQYAELEVRIASVLEKGDTFYFGQHDSKRLVWTVLDTGDSGILCTSSEAVTMQVFDKDGSAQWSESSLRAYLNGDYLDEIFSSGEQKFLQKTSLAASNDPDSGTSGGKDTEDKIYIPSYEDVFTYFSPLKLLTFPESESLAADRGDEKGSTAAWMLRTPGSSKDTIRIVSAGGDPFSGRMKVTEKAAVRLMMVLKKAG